MSTTSDQEMSSCSGSPVSYTVDSPHCSPLQQVPQLTTNFTGLSCAEKNLYTFIGNSGNKPFLRILEQPQDHFRFRYVSEMIGTHGCILGRSSSAHNKNKTHPTVELVNYSGRALIRCELAQHNNTDEHPHKLLEDDQDRDVSYIVPEQGIYKVGFPGMGIIHTAKKDVAGLLYKKILDQSAERSEKKYATAAAQRELKTHCENLAKCMNLNIVRLKFSALDVDTGREICEPVYSEPIHNMKSAATNDLRICRMSLCCGKARGGEDVFIFVEKVNKKNIMIRFFELDENGERTWTAAGTFLTHDVHHQYGIVFRTPPYRDPQTPRDVKVYIELVRPSDGRTSEPKEFTYKAEEVFKKRKLPSSFSSLESSSGGSITNEMPTILFDNNTHDIKHNISEIPAYHIQLPVPVSSTSSECGLGNALGTVLHQTPPSPMWSAAAVPVLAPAPVPAPVHAPVPVTASAGSLPHLQLDSAELNTMSRDVVMETPMDTNQAYLAEYFDQFNVSLSEMSEVNGMDFIRSTLVADSGRVKMERSPSPPASSQAETNVQAKVETRKESNPEPNEQNLSTEANPAAASETSDYPAYYTPSDAAEVKQLVRELCEIMRDKKRASAAADIVRAKLERLFEIRLSNGDTFLHMTLCSNQSSFETIVKVIHSVKMSHLLNYSNHRGETILHLALVHGSPQLVHMLVERGCSPMARTVEEDTCVHYAVRYGGEAGLRALLYAAARRRLPLQLDARNAEGCSALHLCALHAQAACARLLCERGAAQDARDAHRRTPLHLCAHDARADVASALLEHAVPRDVHACDARGRSPLAVVCARRPPAHADPALARLLLQHGARPPPTMARLEHLAPVLREFVTEEEFNALLLQEDSEEDLTLQPDDIKAEPEEDDIKEEPEDDIKEEPEDDVDGYESADDEKDSSPCTGLSGLSEYAREVSRRVDAAGAWRELAHRLDADALLSWFQNQPSPAYTLLNHVKESRDDLTSKSLALILDDMGLSDAANIIRSYIN